MRVKEAWFLAALNDAYSPIPKLLHGIGGLSKFLPHVHSSTYLPRYGRLDSRGPLELRVLEGWTQSQGQTAIEVLDGPGVFVMALRITLVELPATVDGRLPKDVIIICPGRSLHPRRAAALTRPLQRPSLDWSGRVIVWVGSICRLCRAR